MIDVNEFYLQAIEQLNAKDYDAALKVAYELQKLDRIGKIKGYYLEAIVWEKLENTVKEYYALKKILSLLDFSSSEMKDLAADILTNVATVCLKMSLLTESIDCLWLAKKLSNNKKIEYKILDAVIHSTNYLEDSSPDDFRAIYDEYKKSLADIVPYPKKFYEHKKIRVGFMSPDFFKHAVMEWSWALLIGLDKNLFETYCYSNVKNPDENTERLRSFVDGWRDISDLTDEQAAKIIRDDEIDILFDLSGHTKDNRLRVAVYRPASVQMSGIGYMNSTGLECFDYFLSDSTCAGDETFFTEKVIKLKHSHFCYTPLTLLEPADAPPCLKNNFVTFGSFNRYSKINNSILSAWKKILDMVPNSRLLLKTSIFNTDAEKNFVVERLKNFDFDLSRIEMRGFTPNHLAEYADMDIALDTFPYTGGVTTCEALYMGVPVVSLYGKRHGTRFSLSILKNIRLDGLAVKSYDEYINLAVALANDWKLLTILRKNLRPMMKKSPLMDSANYLREIQAAFIKILDEQKNLWRSASSEHSKTLFKGH